MKPDKETFLDEIGKEAVKRTNEQLPDKRPMTWPELPKPSKEATTK